MSGPLEGTFLLDTAHVVVMSTEVIDILQGHLLLKCSCSLPYRADQSLLDR